MQHIKDKDDIDEWLRDNLFQNRVFFQIKDTRVFTNNNRPSKSCLQINSDGKVSSQSTIYNVGSYWTPSIYDHNSLGTVTEIYWEPSLYRFVNTALFIVRDGDHMSLLFYDGQCILFEKHIPENRLVEDFIEDYRELHQVRMSQIAHTGFDGAPDPNICKIGGGNGRRCEGCQDEHMSEDKTEVKIMLYKEVAKQIDWRRFMWQPSKSARKRS